jgi:CRISPR-associated endoribonuclease Cas6
MLASFVIALHVDRDLALPGLGGEALHGLFFEALRRYDPAVAAELHAADDDRPFTLSGLLTDLPRRDGRLLIPAGRRLEFRIGLLSDAVIEPVLGAFGSLAQTPTALRLGPAPARIDGLAFHPGSHPLVRATTYPSLLQRAADTPRLALHFLSPTSFRAGDVQDILPRPEHVFGSLLRTWQTFAPVPLDPALEAALPTLRLSEYELRTELVHFARYKVIGFKGRVTFTCPPEADAATRRALNALADFAFFAGVGYKTTMGLGQVRPWRRGEAA